MCVWGAAGCGEGGAGGRRPHLFKKISDMNFVEFVYFLSFYLLDLFLLNIIDITLGLGAKSLSTMAPAGKNGNV